MNIQGFNIKLGPNNLLLMNSDQHVFTVNFGQDCQASHEELCSSLEHNEVQIINLASVNWPKVDLSNPEAVIESFDVDSNAIAVAVKQVLNKRNSLWVFSPKTLLEESDQEIMERFEYEVDLQTECLTDEVQIVYPLCLVRLSNNKGSFEHVSSRGKPFVLFKFINLICKQIVRTLSIDDTWMRSMSDVLVRYDSDTSLLSSKFNSQHLVVGFGSFSAPDDGGIAVWNLDSLLNLGEPDEVETLDPPTFHWEPWENHCGGVSFLHLDTFSIVAANSCVHRVASRCVEPGDHTNKDNVIVYDFWNVGIDMRRPQRHPNLDHVLLFDQVI